MLAHQARRLGQCRGIPLLSRTNVNLNVTNNSFLSKHNNTSRARTFFSLNKRSLKALEKEANQSLNNVELQVRLFKELNQNYPALVVQRYQKHQELFNQHADIQKEYIKALVATNQMHKLDLLLPAAAAAPQMMAASANGMMQASAGGASPNAPMFVSVVGQGANGKNWKDYALSLAKTAVAGLLIASAFSTLFSGIGSGMARSMGVSSDEVPVATDSDKRFTDVKGVDEAKAELEEIVQYLKDPSVFTRLGGELPKGVLLTGPPGTGKTLLARAIAGEAGVPFFYSSGSQFDEMFVGLGAKRVRDLFANAKKQSPCIIFIDEIDAMAGKRNVKDQNALKMTLNQLLVELDGFEQNSGVIIIGATNFPDGLDSALIRPGRFDRHVTVPLPDIAGRVAILKLHMESVPLASNVSVDVLARATPGMSGADLKNLVNEASIRASVKGLESVNMECLEYAKDKILMGAERKSAVISPESAKLTAYHEGGHALVALNTPGAHPVYKATIMPRGQALGMVSQLPEGDQTSVSRKQLLARLDVCMGGRVAEEMIFGEENVTGGASSDIMQATRIASQMVTRFGMSDVVGPVFHDTSDSGNSASLSPSTRKVIDEEVRRLCDESYARAKGLLKEKKGDLEILAKALLQYETLSGSEIQTLLSGKTIDRSSGISTAPSKSV